MQVDFTPRKVACQVLLVMATAMGSATAHGRLPPLTPEQQQAADARKAKEAETAKQQAEALARVQDQIAARFGKGAQPTADTPPEKVSQKAAETRPTGPHGGTAPSAEAHSGEAQRR